MEQCFEQKSMVGSLKRNDSTSRTTIVTTLVTTIVMPKKTTATPTSTNVICISKTAPPSISQTPTISMGHTSNYTAEPHFTEANGFQSSSIIGIVIGIVLFIFILAFILSKRDRLKRREPIGEAEAVESQTMKAEPPSLLPKFSFEKEVISDEGPLSASVFVDKFTRLNKPYSPGVRWADDGITDQKGEPKAHFDAEETFERSLPMKATVVNTFVTDLADELPVAVGQKLMVLAEYDDGWIFCSNERGEQGMVPVECLHTEEEV